MNTESLGTSHSVPPSHWLYELASVSLPVCMPAKPARLLRLFIRLPWARPEKKKRKFFVFVFFLFFFSPRGLEGALGEEKDQQVLLRERDRLQPERNINRERPGGIIKKINSN